MGAQRGNQTGMPFGKYPVVTLCIEAGEDKCHLDVPFMITADQISNFILGFNAIKHIAQTTDDKLLIKLFHADQHVKSTHQPICQCIS